MNKQGLITYPPFINELSAYVGKLRDLVNYNLNEVCEKYRRGDRSEYVNILGVKGELIFCHYLTTSNITYKTFPLLSSHPISSYDILIGDKKVDVKTIRTDAPDLLVNKEAHEKDKGIDSYVFIQPVTDTTAKYWIFKHSEVSQWKIKNVKYSDAYYINKEEIR